MKLTSDTRARLAKLIRLLGSDNAGEVAAAAHKLQEVLRSSGADLHDLAALLEEERIAAGSLAESPESEEGSPRPPPRSRRRRSRSQARAIGGTGSFAGVAACILAIGLVVGVALAVRGLTEAGPRQAMVGVTTPTPAAPILERPVQEVLIASPPKMPAESALPARARAPAQPLLQAQAAPPPAERPSEAALPKPKPVAAKAEPAAPPASDMTDARDAARLAVGELIRQIRFPQRIDPVTSMVSISAYGSEIVASYRAAVADDTINTESLRRLTLERACEVPIMMSALNRGATHRARYTDLNGHVAEVVISAKDCEP